MRLIKKYFFLMLMLCSVNGFAQSVLQSLTGTVYNANSGTAIAGAQVTMPVANLVLQTTTADNGTFTFAEVPVGRYSLTVAHPGFESYANRELKINSGNQASLEIYLTPIATKLPQVEIASSRYMYDQAGTHTITVEQTQRFASVNEDVARMAQSFAGVTFTNDGANHISVNGHSPNALQWKLEGIEILNPNHLNNGGTITDRPSQAGGGILMMSAQVLDNTRFNTAPFTAEAGNSLSGIFDLQFRKGNTQKHSANLQAGLIGLDASAEGPLKFSKGSSYLFNYRYSTIGILSGMGVDFGGEKIAFQDFSFNLNFPMGRAGQLNIFGVAGNSKDDYKGNTDSTQWETEKEKLEIKYKSSAATVGAAHKVTLHKNVWWKNTLAFSAQQTQRQAMPLDNFTATLPYADLYSTNENYSFRTHLTWMPGIKTTVALGGTIKYAHDNYFNPDFILVSDIQKSLSEGTSYLIQPFAMLTYYPAQKLKLSVGVHDMYYSLNNQNSLEPRAQLQYHIHSKHTLAAAYALCSQTQPTELYYATDVSLSVPNYYFNPNRNTGFTKAHQYSLTYTYLSDVNTACAEVYYHSLFDVPVDKFNPSAYSMLNEQENFSTLQLENKGTGRNCGINASFQKFFTAKYYGLISGSVYDAVYTGSDGIEHNTRFNGKYAFCASGGYEVKKEKQHKVRIISYNLRALYNGGYRQSPVDEAASVQTGYTVYDEQNAFSQKIKDYYRLDFRIVIRKNKSKCSQQWALDIQNITGIENTQYYYYDSVKHAVTAKKQLGLIPVLSWRIEL